MKYNIQPSKITIILLIFLCSVMQSGAQDFIASNTTQKAQDKLKISTDSLFHHMNYNDARSLRLGFWSIVAYNRWSAPEKEFIKTLMQQTEKLSPINRYKLTAIVAKNHPEGWESFLQNTINNKDEKLALLSYHALREANISPKTLPKINKKEWLTILSDLENEVYKQTLDNNAVKDIISHLHTYAPDSLHIIVLVHPDRQLPAELYLLLPGDIRHTIYGPYTYLLSSMYNILPYFTYGDTPCGVYKIFNRAHSKNLFIGPTETIWTALPFELSPDKWGFNKKEWTLELYKTLLPASLQDSPLMWQAYKAGAVGRYDIIIHGSTINPDNFKDLSFYPLTPSLGCLSALELWDKQTGKSLVSHQQDLINMLPDFSEINPGYMYVIQLDDTYFDSKLIIP